MKDVKTAEQAREILEAIGQEDEKQGIRQTQVLMSEWEKEQAALQQKEYDLLGKAKNKGSLPYIAAVADLLKRESVALEIPLEYEWDVSHSPKGVVFKMAQRNNDGTHGKKWVCAFKPCGQIPVDYYAVIETLVRTDTTVQNNQSTSLQKRGFILP